VYFDSHGHYGVYRIRAKQHIHTCEHQTSCQKILFLERVVDVCHAVQRSLHYATASTSMQIIYVYFVNDFQYLFTFKVFEDVKEFKR
jgi:hypothetical protein